MRYSKMIATAPARSAMSAIRIDTVEMHTGGEPVRLVVGGFPELRGETILAKRRYAREHLDHLRRLLIFEPRGHFDMYGAIPVAPDHPEADLAVLFIHNEGRGAEEPVCQAPSAHRARATHHATA